MRSIQAIAASFALMGAPASAFWRMECRGVLGQARLDPLMQEGKVGQHVHEIFGGQAFGETVDYDSLVASDCTSCAVTADKSSYWAPMPYFQDNTTGEYEAVANVGGMLPYYFLNSAPSGQNQSISAFPEGFRMIAGDNFRRNYTVGNSSYEEPDPDKSEWAALGQTTQTDLAQRAIGFNCLDYTKTAEGSLYRHFMPSKEYIDAYCPDGLRFELMFPSCWDGVSLDSDNHKDHVAYPDLVISGNCPDTHPVRLPGLFYETIWDMGSYGDRSGMFVISNGDPTGFGYHGDFIMGWDSTNFTLQQAVDTCTNLDGEIESCDLFTVISEAEQQECTLDLPLALLKEDTSGPVSSLPGDVAIYWGPAPAGSGGSSAASTYQTTATMPTLPYSAGSSATNNGSVLPGNIFKITPATTTVEAVAATTPAPAYTAADEPMVTMGTSTYTYTGADGDVTISVVVIEEAITWTTELTTTTVTVEPTAAAGARRRRDAHAHQHRHAHGRMH